MTWKDWPYWLKGGIIILGIYVITLIFLLFPESIGIRIIPLMTLFPGRLFYFWLTGEENSLLISIFASMIIYFLIGAVIGAAIGQAKKSNSPI